MFNLSDNETCRRYSLDHVWVEALNLESLELKGWGICPKTLRSFAEKITESGLFADIMDCVTKGLAKTANADLGTQRLDSVHVLSNMAKLSRVRLFRRTIASFLSNLKGNHKEEWGSLAQDIRDRYLSEDFEKKDSAFNFFGNATPGERDKTLGAMGQDIHVLLTTFEGNEAVGQMKSFGLLRRP
jgi:hypothetical protein